ncbi:hypothetical protein ATO6_12985 [Oceanicola sp. 22II-s10i]|uniref:DUF6473 family protein n=1 Tax=Oceanicola sp. 22II-s10i TaxID=1317116 RepID=UPI000B51EBD1|nr:DUF6473 family protein [Oceanicola sp. 22II-s10i]OWU84674.1 hypothetical protein ATO6_12985 [Oceanicola sp. 22II-s10i]
MTYETRRVEALDYFPCRYGTSRNGFRGPKRSMEGDYIAFLGGTDTYGRFIPRPFPALVEDRIGMACVNFGWLNAGVDAFLRDDAVMDAARGARAVVLQVPGAQNMSNRYYAVHPRRNDRFLKASVLMRRVFPDADFTEFNFTRHMLTTLASDAPDRFAILVAEMQFAWIARVGDLIRQIGRPVVLLWFADHAPGPVPQGMPASGEPLFVSDEMMAALTPQPAAQVLVRASGAAMARRTDGMVFAAEEAAIAAEVMGPAAHQEAAAALAPAIEALIGAHR